jgi:hypothetical protein
MYLLPRTVGRPEAGRMIQCMLFLRSIVSRGVILFRHRRCFYADDETISGDQALLLLLLLLLLLFWLYVMA